MTLTRTVRCLPRFSAFLILFTACKSDFKKTDTKSSEAVASESTVPEFTLKSPQPEGEPDFLEEKAPPHPDSPPSNNLTSPKAHETAQVAKSIARPCSFSSAQLFEKSSLRVLNGDECEEVHIIFQKNDAILENQTLHLVNVKKIFLPHQFRNIGTLIIESKNESPTLIQLQDGEASQEHSPYLIRTSGFTRIENAVVEGAKRGLQVLLSAKNEIPLIDLKGVEFRNIGTGIDLPQFNSAELTKTFEYKKPFQFLNVSFNKVLVPLSLGFPISLKGFVFENQIQSQQLAHNLVKMSDYFGVEGVFEKGIPYVITQTPQLLPQSFLRITPGAILKFVPNSTLLIGGAGIEAHGTSENKIIFTSTKDDEGGDTNRDEGATSPANLDWNGIRIYKNIGRAQVSMQHAEVRFAGAAIVDSDVQLQDIRFFKGSCSSFANAWDFAKNPIDLASENTITALVLRGTSKIVMNRVTFAEPPEASIVLGGASSTGKLDVFATSVTYENAPKPYVKCEIDCKLYPTQGI